LRDCIFIFIFLFKQPLSCLTCSGCLLHTKCYSAPLVISCFHSFILYHKISQSIRVCYGAGGKYCLISLFHTQDFPNFNLFQYTKSAEDQNGCCASATQMLHRDGETMLATTCLFPSPAASLLLAITVFLPRSQSPHDPHSDCSDVFFTILLTLNQKYYTILCILFADLD